MIKHIAVLGAGTMGMGIARFFATQGIEVRLYDSNPSAMRYAEEEVNKVWGESPVQHQLNEDKAKSAKKISLAGDLGTAVGEADFIIESVSEDLDIKRDLYNGITPFLKDDRVMVSSNTSTFPLSVLSSGNSFANRMLITHFFNPAHIIPLVEVVKLPETIPEVTAEVIDFLTAYGKVPIVLNKEIAGFIANRLQTAVLRESLFLVQQGIASPQDIDLVMKQSIGLRWALNGPFEVADYGGLDVWEKVLDILMPLLDSSTEAPGILTDKVRQHQLGAKTGSGFYMHDQQSAVDKPVHREQQLAALIKALRSINASIK